MNIARPTGQLALPGRHLNQPTSETEYRENTRLGLIHRLPDAFRKHVVAFLGEFVGTVMFLFFAYTGTAIANTVTDASPTAVLLFIALSFGFSLIVNVWIFYRITGGVFNPAVTLGLCLIGSLTWARGLVIFIAQILGAIASAALVGGLFPGPTPFYTSLSAGTSIARGLFIEMFLTAELVFTIFMLAVEKHKGKFMAPLGIGLALFIGEIAGVYYTGGSLNPARSFGPAAVYGVFPGYHWIYWLGPVLGALLAVGFHRIVKGLEYESVNPEEDIDEGEAERFRRDEDLNAGRVRARTGTGMPGNKHGKRGMMSADSEAGYNLGSSFG